MNIIPALCAFLLCAVYGLNKSGELKRRSQLISELKQLVTEFSVRMRCTAPTLTELSESCGGVFGELLRRQCETSPDIRTAWENACAALLGCSFCKREEYLILSEMGRKLGTCSTDGQLSLLSLYSEQLSALSAEAEEALRTKGKLCRSVSALLGAGLAIIIV